MEFALGLIVGIALCAFVFAVLSFFKKPVERVIERTAQRIESAGPSSKGFVFEPPSEEHQARMDIIERNKAEGKDTRIDELR